MSLFLREVTTQQRQGQLDIVDKVESYESRMRTALWGNDAKVEGAPVEGDKLKYHLS